MGDYTRFGDSVEYKKWIFAVRKFDATMYVLSYPKVFDKKALEEISMRYITVDGYLHLCCIDCGSFLKCYDKVIICEKCEKVWN